MGSEWNEVRSHGRFVRFVVRGWGMLFLQRRLYLEPQRPGRSVCALSGSAGTWLSWRPVHTACVGVDPDRYLCISGLGSSVPATKPSEIVQIKL